ncbi:MAG: S-adenosylmethionine synthetase [Ulvibacter sp.]|jgi:S-adenosylmethionine synthetase
MYLFTSESVSAGHPDKIADQISDLILDYFFEKDVNSRVAAESFVTPFKIIIAGEIRSNFIPDYQDIENRIRTLIKDIGYIVGKFSYDKIAIEFLFNKQSEDIALGVDRAGRDSEGAGDQGIMFGYACEETEELMPASLIYSHKILRKIYEDQKGGKISGFGPDAKSQVTLSYGDNGDIDYVDTVLLSIQHQESMGISDIIGQVKPIILTTIPKKFITERTKFLFNPTGKFIVGGPEGDVGLTGRKIVVDTYGGAAAHGGGAFSGKDYTKVDRSGAYIARYLAKNIVAANLAKKCLIQLSYAIGVAEPISIYINSFGTSVVPEGEIVNLISKNIDLTPRGIRGLLQLNKPIYLPTATYGHFGRNYDPKRGLFSWERVDNKFSL